MTYGNIATAGGVEQRLGGSSGGPGYLNRSAFCAPPAIGDGTDFGNSGTGFIQGPGQFNWDISLLKTTRITERETLQFRTEFFNAFNHAQFNNPHSNGGFLSNAVPNLSSGAFGQITTTCVNPRVIQFALKFSF